ncbi:iron dependent repressor, metal binding and dimerization domain protein [Acinetobacter baumannii]
MIPTQLGAQLAERSRRRHHLVLQFLLALGVPREAAETDAEGIEHHVGEATLKAMERFLVQANPPK